MATKLYKIEQENIDTGEWKVFMHWYGMQKGYATGAFRMLSSFYNSNEKFRLVAYNHEDYFEVIDTHNTGKIRTN